MSQRKRNSLSRSQFAIPGKGKGKKKAKGKAKGRYPINDKAHARNALARVAQHGSPAEKKKVRAAVKRKYPSIAVGGKKKGGKTRRSSSRRRRK